MTFLEIAICVLLAPLAILVAGFFGVAASFLAYMLFFAPIAVLCSIFAPQGSKLQKWSKDFLSN